MYYFGGMMRYLLFSCMICMFSCTKTYFADEIKISPTLLSNSLQLIEVKTQHVPDIKGMLYLYERSSTEKNFALIDSFPVTIGKSGFAWDNSFQFKYGSQRLKKEGDGCSPAGLFTLGPIFSYHPMENITMPFEQVDENDLCVDDVHSRYYNALIDADTVTEKDYASFEHMKRNDLLYEYGIWVNYNSDPVAEGNGSCIFMHIWRDENSPTSGCTAMSKENMLKLIAWLDAGKNPMLFQHVKP